MISLTDVKDMCEELGGEWDGSSCTVDLSEDKTVILEKGAVPELANRKEEEGGKFNLEEAVKEKGSD